MKKKITIPATIAQRQLSDIFDFVEAGGEVTFTKYGKEIGVLINPEKKTKVIALERAKKPKAQSKVAKMPKKFKNNAELFKWYSANPIKLGYPIDSTAMIRKWRDEEGV